MAGDKKALLVLDIQNDYFWEKRKKIFTYDTDKLVGNINESNSLSTKPVNNLEKVFDFPVRQ